MLDINSLVDDSPIAPEKPITPGINIVETTDTYGKFYIEPLERGYGVTLGNPMRRTLLSSIAGAAVTWVKMEEVLHEYSVIPHVKEDVMEILYNIGQLRIRPVSGRPGKMRLEVSGEGMVSAGDVASSSDFDIVNPEQHLATIDSPQGSLEIELNVEPGKGYQPASSGESMPRGVLPLDAIFNPVRKVNYTVEKTRVGQVTDYERLILEVWTNATISPSEALKRASEVLVDHFFMFNSLDKGSVISSDDLRRTRMVPAEVYQTPIERLELSPRTLNSLKRASIQRVGQILDMTNEELTNIRNFGVKSLDELNEKLRDMGYGLEDESTETDSEEPRQPDSILPAEEEKDSNG
jgi:DNA-directed RNA polymerase subunit alpha